MEPLVEQSEDPQQIRNQLGWLKQYCVQTGGNVSKIKEHVFIVTPNNKYKIQSFNSN
jgi:SepF-like predicted cell division protein (DUF552 family)